MAPPPAGNEASDEEDDEEGETPKADTEDKETPVAKEASTKDATPPLKTTPKALVDQIQAMPEDEFRKTLAEHPYVAKQLKTIRNTDVDRRANEIAGPVIADLEAKLKQTQEMANKLLNERDDAIKATMTKAEQDLFDAKREAQRAQAELADTRNKETVQADRAAVVQLTKVAIDEYGLTPEQAAEVSKEPNISRYLDKVLKISAQNLKAAREELTNSKKAGEGTTAQRDALQRVKSGASVTAATARSTPPAPRSFDDLERAWNQNPNDPKLDKQYKEARASRFGPFGGR